MYGIPWSNAVDMKELGATLGVAPRVFEKMGVQGLNPFKGFGPFLYLFLERLPAGVFGHFAQRLLDAQELVVFCNPV